MLGDSGRPAEIAELGIFSEASSCIESVTLSGELLYWETYVFWHI